MACRPDLLIFDEPTTALDVTTQIEVLAAIKDVVRQFHTAAIYISHDLAVVAQMADRIMVLRYGDLVEEAPTRQMLSNPQQAYTKSLWAVRSLRKEEEAGDDRSCFASITVDAAYGVPQGAARRRASSVPRGRTVAVVGEFGLGQVDLGAGHHRPAAADRGRGHVRRQAARAPRSRNAVEGAAAPRPDDLSDARHGPQSAPAGARHPRPAARASYGLDGAQRDQRDRRASGDDRAGRALPRSSARASSRAARSSASASPAPSPSIPSSSSATR